MKKCLQVLAAIAATAVLLIVFVPMGVGLLFMHDYYPHLIRDIAKKNHLDLTLTDSRWGWFSSHATLSLTLPETSAPLIIHQTIRPGPLLFVPKHGVRLGFAWVGTDHHGSQLPFSGDTFVTPSLRTHLVSPSAHLSIDQHLIQASQVHYHRFDGHQRHEQTLSADLLTVRSKPEASSDLSVQASGVSYHTQDSHHDSVTDLSTTLHAKHLYLTVGRLGVWEAKHLTATVTQHDNGSTVDFGYHFKTDQLLSPMIAPRQASFTLSINGLNKKALTHLFEQLPKLNSQRADQQFLAMYIMMGDLLSHGARINLTAFHLSSPTGPIHANGFLLLPPPTKKTRNPAALSLKQAKCYLQASMPKNTFIDLLTQHATLAAVRHAAKAHHTKESVQAIAKKMAYAQALQWAAQHLITLTDKHVSFTVLLADQHLYFVDSFHQRRPLVWLPPPKHQAAHPKKATASKAKKHQKKKHS